MDEKLDMETTAPSTECGRLGYAYVPIQAFDKTYSLEESLDNGTMFPELNIPMSEYGPQAD